MLLYKYGLSKSVIFKLEYALHTLLYLAYRDSEVILVNELAKVMQKLSKAELVEAYVGAGGGYTLAKSAEEIIFADVVRVFETEENVLCGLIVRS